MTLLLALLSTISTLAALGALRFAWLTVREGRAARAEDAYERELERLYHLLELVGNLGTASALRFWTADFAVAQHHLEVALGGRPELQLCWKCAEADVASVFDLYVDAREEVADTIKQHLATAPRQGGIGGSEPNARSLQSRTGPVDESQS